MIRVYNRQHRFYCGVDIHARILFIHVSRSYRGAVWSGPAGCLPRCAQAVPQRIVVGCECMFAWYWLVAFESGDIDFNQYPEMNLDVAPVPGWK
jgi:hypothetical protein